MLISTSANKVYNLLKWFNKNKDLEIELFTEICNLQTENVLLYHGNMVQDIIHKARNQY